jgi:hypothetical protein
MAQNIFEQFGLKEVANVQFEALEDNKRLDVKAGDIVMYLDTLKVSTTEVTADQTEAKGGWGNPSLIIWDFNKEINLTLQDALFTMQSLAVMTGAAVKNASSSDKVKVRYNEEVVGAESMTLKHIPVGAVKWIDITTGKRGQVADGSTTVALTALVGAAEGDRIRFFYDVEADGTTDNIAYEITISAANFPGTYRVYGDTLVRNRNGKDSPYQFVINRAKVGSEVTFTMEAEGDPAVFDLNLRVLRDDDGNMIKFIKYDLGDAY